MDRAALRQYGRKTQRLHEAALRPHLVDTFEWHTRERMVIPNAFVNAWTQGDCTALEWLSRNGRSQLPEMLGVHLPANGDTTLLNWCRTPAPVGGGPGLAVVARRGTRMVKEAVKCGAAWVLRAQRPTPEEMQDLPRLAVFAGHLAVLEWLESEGMTPALQSCSDRPAATTEKQWLAVLKWLRERGWQWERHATHAMLRAAHLNWVEAVQQFAEWGAAPNDIVATEAACKSSMNVLRWMARHGHVTPKVRWAVWMVCGVIESNGTALLEWLDDHTDDPQEFGRNYRDYAKGIMNCAVRAGNMAALEWLERRCSAPPGAFAEMCQEAATIAAAYGDPAVLDWLTARGCDVSRRLCEPIMRHMLGLGTLKWMRARGASAAELCGSNVVGWACGLPSAEGLRWLERIAGEAGLPAILESIVALHSSLSLGVLEWLADHGVVKQTGNLIAVAAAGRVKILSLELNARTAEWLDGRGWLTKSQAAEAAAKALNECSEPFLDWLVLRGIITRRNVAEGDWRAVTWLRRQGWK